MSNNITTTQQRNLTTTFSIEDEKLIRDTICKGADETEFKLFIYQAQKTGLNPLARQIYAVKRWDSNLRREAMSIQVSIDGFRLIAERTGHYAGQIGPLWCGEDGVWRDVWLSSNPPVAAKVGALRDDFKEPCWGVARFDAYAQRKKEGTLTSMWAKMGDVMIAKCFDDKTEVLTSRGFRRFADVDGAEIMMVHNGDVLPSESKPFYQKYDGEMVCYESDDIDFCVTPNHDMLTTFGKVEAGAMFETSHNRGPWKIVRTLEKPKEDVRKQICQLYGYVLADGYLKNGRSWEIAVSRQDKIDALEALSLFCIKGERMCAGDTTKNKSGRIIQTKQNKKTFSWDIAHNNLTAITKEKLFEEKELLTFNPLEARTVVDAWQSFDGHTNKKTGVRRVYISSLKRLEQFEFLAIKAGYSVSTRKARTSDMGEINYYVTISDRKETTVFRQSDPKRPSLFKKRNESGIVWCVTVPSGIIIVRRNGFSMLCGNCAEALALRKAFPQELSGLYTNDEMAQASQEDDAHRPDVKAVTREEKPTTTAQLVDWAKKYAQDIGMIEAMPALNSLVSKNAVSFSTLASALPKWHARLNELLDEKRQLLEMGAQPLQGEILPPEDVPHEVQAPVEDAGEL